MIGSLRKSPKLCICELIMNHTNEITFYENILRYIKTHKQEEINCENEILVHKIPNKTVKIGSLNS